jgi:hypothetical protein
MIELISSSEFVVGGISGIRLEAFRILDDCFLLLRLTATQADSQKQS